MDEEFVLKQPTDRRLGNPTELPPGPPGADFYDYESKNTQMPKLDKDSTNNGMKFATGRRTPPPPRVQSPPSGGGGNDRRKSSSRRRSTSRNIRSPSPSSHRRRRSPSTRPRGRYYSPSPDHHHHRRRYDNRRRSPDHRRRSPPSRRGGGGSTLSRRDRERYRGGGGTGGRGRGGSSSHSRSCSPRRHWSPKRKPSTPPPLPAPSHSSRMHQQPPLRHHANAAMAPYNVMPPQMYGQSYGNPVYGNHQYGMPTHAAASFPTPSSYGMQGAPGQQDFNASAYGQPSGTWGINEYGQQVWIPHNLSLTQQPQQQQQMIDSRSRLIPPVDSSNNTHVPTSLQRQQQAEQQHTTVPSSATSSSSLQVEANEQQSVTQPTDSGSNNNTAAATSKQDAVAQEAENQRDELKKQRLNYIKKVALLRHELNVLKDQRLDLTSSTPPASPTTQSFIDENDRLQSQIKKKVDTIENVIDMLTGIIRDDDEDDDDDDDDDDDNDNGEDNNNGIHKTNDDNDENDSNQESHNFYNNNNRKEITGPSTPKSTPNQCDRLASSSLSHQQSDIGEASAAGDSSRKPKTNSSTSDSSVDSSSSTSDSETSVSGSGSGSTSDTENGNDDSPTRLKNRAIKSMKSKLRSKSTAAIATVPANKGASQVYNYVFFDPEQHWCPMCNVFPKSARDYLNHLHSKEHMDQETVETPWHLHIDHDPFPAYADAPVKRVPVRGMEFLVPSSAWFCKLCNFWIGDLHCASAHLKSQTHSQRYEVFLKHSPDYETRWAKDRQSALDAHIILEYEKQQQNKIKKDEEKASSKKRNRKSGDKKEKKKKNKKHVKKHKKISSATAAAASSGTAGAATTMTTTITATSSSSTESSTTDDERTNKQPKKLRIDQPTPLEMPRKQSENTTGVVGGGTTQPSSAAAATSNSGRIGRWTVAQEGIKPTNIPQSQSSSASKNNGDGVGDDRASGLQQQWVTVQPVISESEKKLLEQLKGKLKHKRGGDGDGGGSSSTTANATSNAPAPSVRYNAFNDKSYNKRSTTRRSRSPLTQSRRSMTRSRSRGRVGGGDYRNSAANNDYRRGGGGFSSRRSRTRSRSRGRRRRTRSPRNRRSRSRDNRRRRSSRTRSKTRSRSCSISYGINRGVGGSGNGGGVRIEKPIVKHSEFRPRNSKPNDTKTKKEVSKTIKPSNSNSSNSAAAAVTGKKLPFIGKMPVFKKQSSDAAAAAAGTQGATAAGVGQVGGGVGNDSQQQQQQCVNGTEHENGEQQQQRPARPTAAQIQMAMMEDVYGNAPPFHPEAGMMIDYDELMPDPVQFANLITHGPPPPPPPLPQTSEHREGKSKRSSNKMNATQNSDGNNKGDNMTRSNPNNDDDPDGSAEDIDGVDVLPPGIDESDTDHVPLPLNAESAPQRELPSDLAEALDIIFPSDKPSESDEITDHNEHNLSKAAATSTMKLMTTTLTPVVASTPMDSAAGALATEQMSDFEMRQDEHASQMAYLANQGIHMVMIQQQSSAVNLSTSVSPPAKSVSSLDIRDQPQPPMHDAPHPTTPAAKSILTRDAIALVEQTAMDICSDEDREEEYENQNYESIVVANGQKKIDSNVKVVVVEPYPPTPDVAALAPTVVSTQVLLPTDIPMPQSSPPLSTTEKTTNEAIGVRSSNVNAIKDTSDGMTSPTVSDLEELAMLGIDTNDMAAQCM